MSDVPAGRKMIREICDDPECPLWVRRKLHRALHLFYRVQPKRRAKARRVVINAKTRRAVHLLSKNTNMTEHDIAQIVGLRNGGRVSDVLWGRR